MDASTRILSGPPLRLVQAACLILIAIKVAQWTFSGVFMDEAYYWLWGQHPALSYYDHPPLNAWLLGLSSTVLGWSKLALRAPVVLTFAADIVALWLISRRIGGDWVGHFWLTLLLFLSTPVFTMVTNFAFPDHALLPGLLFAVYFFFCFFADRAGGKDGATRDLLLGAVCLGLAGLAKYNAAFLGLGIAVFVPLYDRALLRQWRLYAAGLIALAMQTPVIAWNVMQRFASYEFILEGRHAGISLLADGIVPLAIAIVVFVGPFLLWPMALFVFSKRHAVSGSGFARATFVLSTIAIVALSFVTVTLFHWNIAAYAVAVPFLARAMRPWFLIPLQALWGLIFAVLIFMVYVTHPLIGVNGWRDQSVPWAQDWTPVVQAVKAAQADNDIGFIAAADYMTASPLAFALGDKDVTSLAPNLEQQDFWFDPAAHTGQTAILYGDSFQPITSEIGAQFESMEQIASIPVIAQGQTINVQVLYLAKGFKPAL